MKENETKLCGRTCKALSSHAKNRSYLDRFDDHNKHIIERNTKSPDNKAEKESEDGSLERLL